MLVGVFSGSFNPVHNGHIALAEWFVREHVVDTVCSLCCADGS